jgi:hypothetical protein
MWPDDDRLVPFGDVPTDPELSDLAASLERAGRRAGSGGVPSPAFAAALRSELLGRYPAVPAGSLDAPAAAVPSPASEAAVLAPVTPRVARRVARSRPRVEPAPRLFPLPAWSGVLMAAVVLVALVAIDHRSLAPPGPSLIVADAASATVQRGPDRFTLEPGMALQAGDVVRTADGDGRATLALAGGETRLAPSTAVRIVAAGIDLTLDQLAGRTWHRVGGAVGTYTVRTDDVAWVATGTAFDLDRRAAAGGGEEVRAVAIEHDVRIEGRTPARDLPEGFTTVVPLSDPAAEPTDGGPISDQDGADPWLLENARRDVVLDFDVGPFARYLVRTQPDPTPLPTAKPTPIPTPSFEPAPTEGPIQPSVATDPTAAPTPRPTPRPTARPTPKPTARPTPKPTPTPAPDLAQLSLNVTGCNGGFAVLAWSKAPADGFDHYQTLRSTGTTIAPKEPPVPPAVAPDALYAEGLNTLSAIDAGLDGGTTFRYRTVAFRRGSVAYAASPVKTAAVRPVKALGALTASVDAGVLSADWTPFAGPEACFTWYKLVASTSDETPSYAEGAETIWVWENKTVGHASVEGLPPGTYHLRLETLRTSGAGPRLVARTDVATVTMP